MKVYMDDERETPQGWTRTYTVDTTINLLETRKVTHLSLDNDLGDLNPSTEGFNVLNWLEEKIHYEPSFPLPQITVHSANSARAQTMRKVIEKLRLAKLNMATP